MMTTDDINNTINANQHNSLVKTDDICDGFHTFGQLYFQRMILFATLVNLFPELSWKTIRHEDGEECFGGGWFLVTIDTPAGPYGYHYEMKYWNFFHCDVLDKAKHWDGYTEENVDRLFSLTAYASLIQFVDKKYFTKHEINDDSLSPCIKCTSNVSSCTGCPKYFEWKEKMEDKNEDRNKME